MFSLLKLGYRYMFKMKIKLGYLIYIDIWFNILISNIIVKYILLLSNNIIK